MSLLFYHLDLVTLGKHFDFQWMLVLRLPSIQASFLYTGPGPLLLHSNEETSIWSLYMQCDTRSFILLQWVLHGLHYSWGLNYLYHLCSSRFRQYNYNNHNVAVLLLLLNSQANTTQVPQIDGHMCADYEQVSQQF